jgi:hypothetical protein
VGRGNRAYKSAKRSKELHRLKKQEEKRLRRLGKLKPEEPGEAAPDADGPAPEVDLLDGLISVGGETEGGTPESDDKTET